MKAKFDAVETFMNTMSIVTSILDEPLIRFEDDGIVIEGNDRPKTSYLKVKIAKSFFIEYERGDDELCISVRSFLEILKKIPKTNSYCVIEKGKENWFVVRGKSIISFKYKLPIISSQETQMMKPKNMTFDYEIFLPSKILEDMSKVSINKTGNIIFYCTDYFLNVQDDDKVMGLSMQRVRKSTIVQIKCNSLDGEGKCVPARAKYNNSTYLSKILPIYSKISDKVKLSFGDNYPMMLFCEIKGITVEFVLAPIVEREPTDEEQAPEEFEDE